MLTIFVYHIGIEEPVDTEITKAIRSTKYFVLNGAMEKPEEDALLQWQKCYEFARPEYIHEYKWFMEVGQDDMAYCVNTKHIVDGYEEERFSANKNDIKQWCKDKFGLTETEDKSEG